VAYTIIVYVVELRALNFIVMAFLCLKQSYPIQNFKVWYPSITCIKHVVLAKFAITFIHVSFFNACHRDPAKNIFQYSALCFQGFKSQEMDKAGDKMIGDKMTRGSATK
jgi:hypothetical protein